MIVSDSLMDQLAIKFDNMFSRFWRSRPYSFNVTGLQIDTLLL